MTVKTMARIISVTNQKGGVGKTTNTVHIAAALGQRGYRCLILDLDQPRIVVPRRIEVEAVPRSQPPVALGPQVGPGLCEREVDIEHDGAEGYHHRGEDSLAP